MKKLMFLACFALLSTGIVMLSCKKEAEIKTNSTNNTIQNVHLKSFESPYPWLCISWNDDHTQFVYFCDLKGGNCLPEVVIHGNVASFEAFIKYYQLGKLTEFFNIEDYWAPLFPELKENQELLKILSTEQLYWYNLPVKTDAESVYVATENKIDNPEKTDFTKINTIVTFYFTKQ